jgi:hypothetical protein
MFSSKKKTEHATSLHRNSDVAPKKLEQCSFAIDIKEHKQVRTYYLSAYSEGEKKQWLDAMLASKKWYAAQAAAVLSGGTPAKAAVAQSSKPALSGSGDKGSSAKLEQELEEAQSRIRKLLAENKQLKQDLEERGKGGSHEEMLLELEEMEERFEQEKKKRLILEKQLAGSNKAGMVDESELEALKDKSERKRAKKFCF